MREAVIISEQDALLCEVRDVVVYLDFGEVLGRPSVIELAADGNGLTWFSSHIVMKRLNTIPCTSAETAHANRKRRRSMVAVDLEILVKMDRSVVTLGESDGGLNHRHAKPSMPRKLSSSSNS
jgi:hypothetical protein